MKTHPLKVICITSILALIASQSSLIFWLNNDYRLAITALLTLPLLLPLKGILTDNRYTYKWLGFLTFLYFCVGVSEAFANPELRIYGSLTVLLSCLLFVSSIYYSRYLRIHEG
jgi:uncharacterized membrane protein